MLVCIFTIPILYYSSIEKKRLHIDLDKPESSVWNMLLFTGAQTQRIFEAQRIGGYSKIEDLYNDAVMDYCDGLIADEKMISIHELPFLGSAAARATSFLNSQGGDCCCSP